MRLGNKNIKTLILLFLVTGFIFFYSAISAQIYGLRFQAQNVPLDKRTGLNLTPTNFLNFEKDFEISFDYKTRRLIPNSNIGLFGYIFRIVNKDNINVDFLITPTPQPSLNVVAGKTNSVIRVKYPKSAINNWINIRVRFITSENKLIFYTPDTFYVQNNIGFKEKDSYKIIFGANDYQEFKTTDVPSMIIKDLKIFEQGKLKHEWLLNETKGNIASDGIKNKDAFIRNPKWIKPEHQEWEVNLEKKIDGNIIVAFDKEQDRIFLLGTEEFYIYSTKNNSIKQYGYKNKPGFFDWAYRAIYNSTDNKIYCYLVDRGPCYSLDIETREWNTSGTFSVIRDKFTQHNSYYNSKDNSIYLFGGYGQYLYHNEVKKINLTKNNWEDLPTNDSIYYPRYWAGMGDLHDTIYILGGHGSITGDQLINPHSYFDLLAYSIKDSSWTKKLDIPHVVDNMLVGNSFVIDELTRSYYALVFDKLKSDGFIQLIRGSLDSPEVDFVGDKIPFTFLDIKSFTSLYYIQEKEKLIAYTSYYNDSSKTEVAIHSIKFPPNKFLPEPENGKKLERNSYPFHLAAFVILIGVVMWFLWKRKKGMAGNKHMNDTDNEIPVFDSNGSVIPVEYPAYQLTLFGGFQVLNKESEDITNQFSRLLKELFLLILLHTFKNDKGITIEKISEILWFDKSDQSARNNRAVNIRKLRTLLMEVGSCSLSKETGYWKMIFNEPKMKCDYIDFLKLTASKTNLTKQKIYQLLCIVEKGAFLGNVHYNWLDEFKANISDTIINTMVKFAGSCDIKKEADFIIHLADSIFNFDVINEDALILKCKAQHCMGKYSHAKTTYEKFCREYLAMYDQEYEHSFVNILEIKE